MTSRSSALPASTKEYNFWYGTSENKAGTSPGACIVESNCKVEEKAMAVSMLDREAFEAARQFIEQTARPLEVARFRQAFAGGSVDAVIEALRSYQNSDGGFGHALEPDLRTKESSALCTSVAFQVLRSVHVKPVQAFVSKAIGYLLQTLDRAEGHWRIIPVAAEQSPHAPWWTQAGREEDFARFSLNPSAEMLGYLFDHQALVPRDILSQLSARVLGCISALETIEMHDLLCCLRLLHTETLPGEICEPLKDKLAALISGIVACDPEQWSGYSLRPLQVVEGPGSPFMPGLEEGVVANLEYEIASQNQDGVWTPTWTWGGAYPEDWEIAQREWSGIITLEKLLVLKRFGRIEGHS